MTTFRLFNRYWFLPAVVSLLVEAALLVSAVLIAKNLRDWALEGWSPWSAAFLTTEWQRVAVFVLVVLLNLYFHGHYDFTQRVGRRQVWIRLARALTLSLAVLLVIYFLTENLLTIGRIVLFLSLFCCLPLLAAWRELLTWLLRRPLFGSRILIVGADHAGAQLAREILSRRHLGYHIIGFLDDDPKLLGTSIVNPSVIGTTADALRLAKDHHANMIVVALRDKRGKLNIDDLLSCKNNGIPVEDASPFIERLTGKLSLETLRKSWLVFSQGFVSDRLTLALKRTIDIVFALLLILLTSPFMILAALAILVSSPGPVVFRQRRVGLRGRVFTLWKFRSMVARAEAPGQPRWATENDPRITPVGRFLRKSRLDELPQLWNVLAGHMSLVGPRPERPVFVERLKGHSSYYHLRHEVRPGITGWAQIMAPYASSVEQSMDKLEFDLFYIKNLSVWLDLTIVLSTARIVVLGRGAR